MKTRILSEQMLKAEHETFQLVLLHPVVAWISTCALTKSSFYDSDATVMHWYSLWNSVKVFQSENHACYHINKHYLTSLYWPSIRGRHYHYLVNWTQLICIEKKNASLWEYCKNMNAPSNDLKTLIWQKLVCTSRLSALTFPLQVPALVRAAIWCMRYNFFTQSFLKYLPFKLLVSLPSGVWPRSFLHANHG